MNKMKKKKENNAFLLKGNEKLILEFWSCKCPRTLENEETKVNWAWKRAWIQLNVNMQVGFIFRRKKKHHLEWTNEQKLLSSFKKTTSKWSRFYGNEKCMYKWHQMLCSSIEFIDSEEKRCELRSCAFDLILVWSSIWCYKDNERNMMCDGCCCCCCRKFSIRTVIKGQKSLFNSNDDYDIETVTIILKLMSL